MTFNCKRCVQPVATYQECLRHENKKPLYKIVKIN